MSPFVGALNFFFFFSIVCECESLTSDTVTANTLQKELPSNGSCAIVKHL